MPTSPYYSADKKRAIILVTDTVPLHEYASFDFHLAQNCMGEVVKVSDIVKELIKIGRNSSLDNKWSQRESYLDETLNQSEEDNKMLGLCYGALSKDKDILEVRRIVSQINMLVNQITRSLFELRLMEDELTFYLKNTIG